ncbi:MAG: hypothetical protein N4A33_11385 [Bacteriovoracaceae bacterium]|jgi:hypothetical protein|nr:hypothetical protein [Bacteriovoracaceae bacterium]
MNFSLIIFLILSCFSLFANEYNCYSEQGSINIKNKDRLIIDFNNHNVSNADYFEAVFRGPQETDIPYSLTDGIATIEKIKLKKDYMFKLKETGRFFFLRTRGGADFSAVKLKLHFDKKKLKLKLKFTEHTWLMLSNKIKDTLKCHKY